MNKYIVITTIHPASSGIAKFARLKDWTIVLVGDRKTPNIASSGNIIFLSIEDQNKLGYTLTSVCPYNHYARKNIGYLYAIQQGADIIYDTDDDNFPYDNHWCMQDFVCNKKCISNKKFFNVYRYFSKELIWPRGYPLDEINQEEDYYIQDNHVEKIGVWQGLVDIDPDVDAIFRLTFNKRIKFEYKPPIFLRKENYCPFNSQNTFWHKKAFPYLYLPGTSSFRFTDILRGYITQRLMWEQEIYLGFTPSTVYHKRNTHDLMHDFIEEIECFTTTKPLITILDSLELESDPLSNLECAYVTLAKHKLIKANELEIFQSWLTDYRRIVKA